MSKIYRSIDTDKPFVKSVDARQTPLRTTTAPRPQGGFFGAKLALAGAAPVSLAERRERDARQLIEEAEGRAEAIQREAWRAGFEEGDKAGRKLAVQKAQPAMQTLSDLIGSISVERDALLQRHKNDLIKIAFLIAERAVHKTIELAPETVASVVAEALAKVSKSQDVTLRVSPQDLPVLEMMIAEGEAPFAASERMKLTADETIGRGGCRIVTPIGDIDATIAGQLSALQSALW